MSTTVLDRPVTPVREAPVPEPPPLDPRRLPPTRLSEAMRKGARFHPQGPGYVYNPYTRATCALGATLVGLIGPRCFEAGDWSLSTKDVIEARTGVSLDQLLPNPWGHGALQGWFTQTKGTQLTIGQAITFLNDTKGWSREQIADWLDALGY